MRRRPVSGGKLLSTASPSGGTHISVDIEQCQAVEAILRYCGPQVRFQPFERAVGPLAGRRRYRQRGEDVKEPGDDWE